MISRMVSPMGFLRLVAFCTAPETYSASRGRAIGRRPVVFSGLTAEDRAPRAGNRPLGLDRVQGCATAAAKANHGSCL